MIERTRPVAVTGFGQAMRVTCTRVAAALVAMLSGCADCGNTIDVDDGGNPIADATASDAAATDLSGRDSARADQAATDLAAADLGTLDHGAGDASQTDRAATDLGGVDHGGPGSCSVVPQFDLGLSPTSVIHVSASGGDDDNNDGSSGSPFATIRRGVQAANPGTAVRIHSGTYPGGAWLENVAGTAQAPIWIGGAPGETRPIVNSGSEAMHLVRPAYVVVHDLEVTGTTANGINCDDGSDYANQQAAHHVIFRNLSIHDVGGDGNQDCLKLSGLNDYVVVDCDFARCGGNQSGSGIDHVGCHRGLIARNRFDQMSGNAVQCKGGSSDLEIRWNWIADGGERGVNLGGSTGLEYFRPPLSTSSANAEARDIRVVANVFERGVTPFGFVGCVGCLAAHNTIIDPTRWLLRILQETVTGSGYTFEPCGNNRIANNLFSFAHGAISGEHVNIGANTAPATFSFDHNLWYAHDSPSDSLVPLPSSETDAVVGQDPLFIAVGDETYHVSTGSPARAAGVAIGGVVGDMSGGCYLDPPAIGAYEVSH